MSKYLEVSISISTDSLPTSYRQITDSWRSVNRQIAKTMEKTVGWLLANSRPTVLNCGPSVGGGELFFTITNVWAK